MLKLDVGCGQNKKKGFLGIDIAGSQDVDFVLDITKDKVPIPENSVDEVFSNHFFEHIDSPKEVLEELIRISIDGAVFEIWTPYLKSDEAFLLGHRHFYNETIWRHICIEYPHFWLKDVEATLRLDKFFYVFKPDAAAELERLRVPFSFALKHMFNIVSEMGAFMTVIKGKDAKRIPCAEPERFLSSSKQGPFKKMTGSGSLQPTLTGPKRLRRKISLLYQKLLSR